MVGLMPELSAGLAAGLMTETALEVMATGPLASIQDQGRFGMRRVGIPWAGTLAPAWQAIANAMVTNALDAPIIECFEGGFTIKATGGAVQIGVAGDATLELVTHDAQTRKLPGWQSHTLQDGDRLVIKSSGKTRCTLLSVAGVRIPHHHHSASTYARAHLGGLDGQALKCGDRIAIETNQNLAQNVCLGLSPADAREALALMCPDDSGLLSLFAMPGPQHDAFAETELESLFSNIWTVGSETDRMGVRLDGYTLVHRDTHTREIVSDAILPGSIQVPGNGRPILMLADAGTVGGYPKIATVVSCDLGGIALARPGTRLSLLRCTSRDAIERVRAAAAQVTRLVESVQPMRNTPDTQRLLGSNLIDGVINAVHD
jgi:allophanate hydrolase